MYYEKKNFKWLFVFIQKFKKRINIFCFKNKYFYNHQNLQFSAQNSHSTSMNKNLPFGQNDFFSSALEITSHTQTWIPDTLITSTDQNLGEIFWIVSNDLILENSFVSNQHTSTNET